MVKLGSAAIYEYTCSENLFPRVSREANIGKGEITFGI